MKVIIKITTIQDKIIEYDIEETTGMKIMKEVGVGPEKDSYHVIEGMLGA